jgi:hypothetical protein
VTDVLTKVRPFGGIIERLIELKKISRGDTMRWNVVVLSLVAALSLLLVNMVGLAAAQEDEGDPQPSYAQPTLFVKGDNDRAEDSTNWMDADPNTNGSQSHQSDTYLGSGTHGETYLLEPPLDHALYLDPEAGNIILHLHMDRQDTGGHSAAVTLTFSAGNIAVTADVEDPDDQNWHYEINLSEDQTVIDAETQISFEWEYSFTGGGGYQVYTDGSSFIQFPIALDTDGDGVPDTIDSDDDNDGYSDEKEISAGTNPLDPQSHPSGDGGSSSDDSSNPLPGFEGIILLAAAPVAIIAFRRRRF